MADNHVIINGEVVPVKALTPDQVKSTIAALTLFIKGVAALTPNTLDDRFATLLEQYGQTEWMVNLIVVLLNVVGEPLTEDQVKGHVQAYFANK